MNSGPHSPHQQPLSIPSQHEPSHNTPYRRTLGHHTGAQLRQGNAWRGIRTHTHTQAGRLTHPEADTTPPLTSSRLGLSPAPCAGCCFLLWGFVGTLMARRCACPSVLSTLSARPSPLMPLSPCRIVWGGCGMKAAEIRGESGWRVAGRAQVAGWCRGLLSWMRTAARGVLAFATARCSCQR